MSIYDHREQPAYRSEAFRPYTNRNILKWWEKKHDNLIVSMIEKWQWHWYLEISEAVISNTSPERISSFLATQNANNKIMYFAITRAQKLNLTKHIREPKWKTCPLCNQKFIESSLPHPFVKSLGITHLEFCSPCLRNAISQNTGNKFAKKKEILQYARDLTKVLQRIPSQEYGTRIDDLHGLSYEEQLAILQQLKKKPTTKRMKELFGSWINVLIKAGILNDEARRTGRGIRCIANDGHICFSLGEKTIDDFLFLHNISHTREPHYPEGQYRADFYVNGVFIEYFGLQGDLEYDKKTKLKQRLCKKHGIQLVSIFPIDLSSGRFKSFLLKVAKNQDYTT